MTQIQQTGLAIAAFAAFVADAALAIQYPPDPPEFKNGPKFMWRAYVVNFLILAIYIYVFGVPK